MLIRTIFLFLLVCNFTLSAFAQEGDILLTIGDNEISKVEFERIYKKNNNNLYNEGDKKTPKEYLELFVDYKLKVTEAKALKMDTNSVFVNELNGYRKELAAPYLTDVKYTEDLVHELYDRMSKEVNASHILLLVDKNASAETEQTVLNKILEIRKEILTGKDFGEAAIEYSQDPSAKTNKGNLSYFTAFQMVAPFENAAFSTPIDELSEPVRSSFGYHLIQVHDIRKNRGEIRVAHIMKMFPKNATEEVKEKVKEDIYEIYIELQNGADFAEMAKLKSDDGNSASKGGEMPWFAAGRMIKEFSEPAFALKNTGDYTPPVETQFGYHIIKKLEEKGIASFEDLREGIEEKIKKDPERSTTSKKAFTDKLKLEYNYSENTDEINRLKNKVIGTENKDSDFTLFVLDGEEYGFELLRNYLVANKIAQGTYGTIFDKWVEDEITALEDSKLEEKYPEFRYLYQEYYEGILLFNISEEMIWNRASEDTVGLEAYYKDNDKKYLWEERFKGSIISCKDMVIREEADKYFGAELSNTEILDRLNSEKEMITIEEGAWEKGSNIIVDYYVWNGQEPEEFNSELTFIRGDIIQQEPKTLNEARGAYISDYQNHLESNWLKELHKKYKITVNKKILKTIESI